MENIQKEENKNISLLLDEMGKLSLNSEKYGEMQIKEVSKLLSPDELNILSNHLDDGAKLELYLTDNILSDAATLASNLKFAGFLKVSLSEENKKISCHKKAWNNNKAKKNQGANTWKAINLDDNANTDFIVEEELIDPFDSYQKFSKAEDCITKPKPCKNCNCGRAEKENQEKQKTVDPNFKPECGKCYLGDAFRCQGCPYRGLPAFEPGQKIEFKNTTQTDVGTLEEEKSGVTIKNNKVKLDI